MNKPRQYLYCQKLVIFRANDTEVLLAKRKGEADYNQTYSFIGGKVDETDTSLLAGLMREKNEEIGKAAVIQVNTTFSYNTTFTKKSGEHMILPHYYARYQSGKIALSDEYSDFTWVRVADLVAFEPKIENVPVVVAAILSLRGSLREDDLATI